MAKRLNHSMAIRKGGTETEVEVAHPRVVPVAERRPTDAGVVEPAAASKDPAGRTR